MTCDMSAIALARGMSEVLSLSFNALICSKRISLRSLMVFLLFALVCRLRRLMNEVAQ